VFKQTATPPRPTFQPRLAVFLLALPPLLLAIWLAGWTGNDPQGVPLPGAQADFLFALLTSLPWAAAWLAAAWGYGWAAAHWLIKWHQPLRPGHDRAVEIGLGVAALLLIDVIAGSLGILNFAGSLGAWIILLAGLVLLIARAALTRPNPFPHSHNWFTLAWLGATPALAVLLIAACSAPGWLWRTEFGGYDALSYHLQLPREWIAGGHIQGFTHNVYSFMPNFMESAYVHIATLVGDPVHAAYACQLLHAGIAILAAWMIGRVANHFAGQIAGFCAFVAVIGTPWTIVTGSLAYNEMAVVLLFATAVLVCTDTQAHPIRRCATIGFLVGIACGAKLTSIGFVAIPIGAFALLMLPKQRVIMASLVGTAMFLLALSPYFMRNVIETGNPVFPFATGVFGLGQFTPEQAQIWAAGHAGAGGIDHKLSELWNQFARFGIGPSPSADEPWLAQWSILPWLGMLGLGVAIARRSKSAFVSISLVVMLALQMAFWLFFTHLKSRFMLPSVVPLSLGIGLGVATLLGHFEGRNTGNPLDRPPPGNRVLGSVGVVLALAWCMVPVFIFAGEPQSNMAAPAARVGRIDFITGEAFAKHDREQLAGVSHVIAINNLPSDAHTLLIGEASPFYLAGHITYQTTWDRGPMSHVMREYPDNPQQWIAALREQGFTHLFVNSAMLERWERAGWNDPLITAARVSSAAEQFAVRVQVTPAGNLYRLK